MFHLVLYQPEIPPNTGNIIRLCANSGARLHLIRPLGFELEDSKLRRAGLDYHEFATVREYDNLAAFYKAVAPARVFAFSTRGHRAYSGPEPRGLPAAVLASVPAERRLRIPMLPGNRSLNLSNAAAVVIYEAWRQHGFAGSG